MIIEFPRRQLEPVETDVEDDSAEYIFTEEGERSWAETAKRVELIIHCFENPYIYIDAEFERHRARYIARAQYWLAYCRTRLPGTLEDAETENEMFDFFSSLGLSLDWILSGDLDRLFVKLLVNRKPEAKCPPPRPPLRLV